LKLRSKLLLLTKWFKNFRYPI